MCLATQEWDAHWSVAQQVASQLAPSNRVIYVEPFHPPFAWLRKKNSLLKAQRATKSPEIREVRDNITVYRPASPYLPGNMRISAAYRWNSWLYVRELRSMMRRLNAQNPILWAFFAQTASVTEIPCEAFVYDCVDDWPSFFPDPVERAWVERMDAALTKRADIVFTGSDPLREKKGEQNRTIRVVNHAADIAHFGKASLAATPVPADIEKVPHPRVGFVGMIDPLRFDPAIIESLARAEGGKYQIVIVGGFLNGADKLIPDLPNVHRIGMRSVPELPGYLKGMDVCIMPYRLNETTRYIFPLKLFEYLATGKPIVGTPIPAVQKHAEHVYVASSNEEFVELTARALREDSDAERERRQHHAAAHDWLAHVTRKAEFLLETLRDRGDVSNRRDK